MKLNCKSVGCFAMALFIIATGASRAAENYPNKPGRLILPFGAGGSTDVVGRIFAQRFSEAWGQTLVIDNRSGAAGIIGTEMAARAPTDGHTIFTYGINQAITAGLHNKLPYDHLRDFSLISLYAAMPNILCVTTTLPAANVSEFVKLAKSNPGKFKYASSGVGASPHLTMEYFKSIAGIDLVHVPYKNSAQGYVDTISGEVQSMFFNLPGPLPHVKAGRLRALAVSSKKRAEQVPEPTHRHRIRHTGLRSDCMAGLRGAKRYAANVRHENTCSNDESARIAGTAEELLRQWRRRRADNT
jgi:tripartite-type tricarboxylate transporter receptor subunit TctC